MRRISFALALLTAAAAGCSGGTAPDQGGARGVAEGTFTVTVQNGQNGNTSLAITGGYVTSTPAGIDCGVAPHNACSASFTSDSTVTLTATPVGAGIVFYEWAGDCQGAGGCTLSGKADKYILARFGTPADRTSHSNWSNPETHAAQYRAFALQCNACHGLNWTGLAIAPSCKSCHDFERFRVNEDALAVDGHFAQDAGAWHDHNGWTQACLRCHTSQGYQDYVGVDGSPNYLSGTFLTDNALSSTTAACEAAENCNPAAYRYGPLTCKTCHNGVTDPVKAGITRVLFPSGNQVTTNRATALCGQCHQGRESTTSVNTAIGTTGLDAFPMLTATGSNKGFINPHYLGAAATMFGAEAAGWAQYAGKIYTGKNQHGVNAGSCTSCHDKHTGHLPADGAEITAACGSCHFDELSGAPVSTYIQLEESRQFGFEGDIDGNGVAESIKLEIAGLAITLNDAMVAYSTDVIGSAITYTDNYPYYMNPAGTAYNTFSPRLMRAAFNYKWYKADPGAWAHNPRYAIEILYDAILDLKAGLVADGVAGGMTAADAQAAADLRVPFNGFRSFSGHFGGAHSAAPYRAFVYSAGAWSADGQPVAYTQAGFGSAACYQCHGGQGGFEQYLASNGTGAGLTTANKVTGMQCTTCHAPAADDTNFARIRTIGTVYMPPGKSTASANQVSFNAANLPAGFTVCATCHAGRENKTSVDLAIGSATDADWTIGFVNPHYLGAAGVLFGSTAHALYEYEGKTYTGLPPNWAVGTAEGPHGSPHGARCTGCHQPKGTKHTFEIDTATTVPVGTYHGVANTQACDGCHVDATASGGGDYRLAPKKLEVEEAAAELYTAIQAYATGEGKTICYNGGRHPYWFADDDSDGTCATTTSALLNPRALKAAYNFKWAHAEPGAYAHNLEYMMEALYDSIVDLGGAPTFAAGADRPIGGPSAAP